VGLTCVLAAFPALDGMWMRLAHAIGLDRLDDGTRGPIRSLVDAVSGFIPGYAQAWTNAFERHPIEFGVLSGSIIVSLLLSTVLQGRIQDRARLSWHQSRREDYVRWLRESQKGWRTGMLLAFGAALVGQITAYVLGAGALLQVEL